MTRVLVYAGVTAAAFVGTLLWLEGMQRRAMRDLGWRS